MVDPLAGRRRKASMAAVACCWAPVVGRLGTRFDTSKLIGLGCLIAAICVFGLSQLTVATPFALTAFWYVLYGIGFSFVLPVIANVAMANVPSEASGIASGVLNASRQVGTSLGLAIIGSAVVSATASAWHDKIGALSGHALARALTGDVTGGQIGAVRGQLGARAAQLGREAFLHGYEIAIIVSALPLVAASITAYAGARVARTNRDQEHEHVVETGS